MAGARRHPLIPILFFSLACGAVGYFALRIAEVRPSWLHIIPLLYYFVLTLALHHWQERSLASDPKGFVKRFMIGLSIKLFTGLILVAAILLTLPRDVALPIILLLLFFYLAFLAFSTVRMIGLSRNAGAS